jgi:hypothetical protein
LRLDSHSHRSSDKFPSEGKTKINYSNFENSSIKLYIND